MTRVSVNDELVTSERRFEAMGTEVHLVLIGPGASEATSLLDDAETLIRRSERRWSRFIVSSEVSQLNRTAGHLTVVSEETFDLLEISIQAWSATNGAFDPTVGAAVLRSGYDGDFDLLGLPRLPTEGTSGEHVGPTQRRTDRNLTGEIQLHRTTLSVQLPPETILDFGGIAKGYVADLTAELLTAAGVDGCCVNIGGDVRVAGIGPDDGGWNIEVICAGAEENRVLRLSSGAVCTSSKTKRRWLTPNGPAHHLIDPTTGGSRTDGPQTVAAVAATATSAEVIAKWMMAEGDPGRFDATGLVVSSDGIIVGCRGLNQYLVDSKLPSRRRS